MDQIWKKSPLSLLLILLHNLASYSSSGMKDHLHTIMYGGQHPIWGSHIHISVPHVWSIMYCGQHPIWGSQIHISVPHVWSIMYCGQHPIWGSHIHISVPHVWSIMYCGQHPISGSRIHISVPHLWSICRKCTHDNLKEGTVSIPIQNIQLHCLKLGVYSKQ